MQCRICKALKRELDREGVKEATATLKQRARLMAWIADHSPQDELEESILVSRKRRANIATELYMHQEIVHGAAKDQ